MKEIVISYDNGYAIKNSVDGNNKFEVGGANIWYMVLQLWD